MPLSELAAELTEWIRARVHEAGARGVVLGMSGGLDSSIAAVLCKRAFPDTTLGLILPCFSRQEDLEHARLVASVFRIETNEIELTPCFTLLHDRLQAAARTARERAEAGEAIDLAAANLKPRLRMCCLYYFANSLHYLVVGTGNKSELAIGYFTKYGDGAVDILPLGDLLKTELRALAELLGIPGEIIEKPPSAGLWEGQTDEGEIGVHYADLDRIIIALEQGETHAMSCGSDPERVLRVKRMMEASRHKREHIPIFKRSR